MKNLNSSVIFKSAGMAAFALLIAGCLLTSCEKKKLGCMDMRALNYDPAAEEQGENSCVLAGRPGPTNIVVRLEHHGDPIYNKFQYKDSVYMKFNTLEFPGDNPALYDFIAVGDKEMDSVFCSSLTQGNYYIFAAGFDPSINQRVKGGIPYTLLQPSGNVHLVIPVTE